MYLYKSFTHLKTTHSYHLVDPSPWRAAVRCARSFPTQETHLSSCERCLGKPLTRIFYLYTDYYLGLACQCICLSTAGHTGKSFKSVKPIPWNILIELIVVQIFLTSAILLLMGNRSLRMLGMGIRYNRRNIGIFVKHTLRPITNTSSCWEGNRGGSKKQFSLLRQTEENLNNEPTNNIYTSGMKGILINDKDLFPKATSSEALMEAWTQLKSKPGMHTPGSDNETLQDISK